MRTRTSSNATMKPCSASAAHKCVMATLTAQPQAWTRARPRVLQDCQVPPLRTIISYGVTVLLGIQTTAKCGCNLPALHYLDMQCSLPPPPPHHYWGAFGGIEVETSVSGRQSCQISPTQLLAAAAASLQCSAVLHFLSILVASSTRYRR